MNTENNKIIAEFMGLELEETLSGKFVYARNEFNNPNKENDCQTNFYEANELCFHSDWNWLMEVVDKIESLGYISNQDSRICEGSLKPIYYFRIFIKHYKGQNVGYSKANTGIEAVYNACVEFIKWYNDENNS
jgi:hypothetical protein